MSYACPDVGHDGINSSVMTARHDMCTSARTQRSMGWVHHLDRLRDIADCTQMQGRGREKASKWRALLELLVRSMSWYTEWHGLHGTWKDVCLGSGLRYDVGYGETAPKGPSWTGCSDSRPKQSAEARWSARLTTTLFLEKRRSFLERRRSLLARNVRYSWRMIRMA